MTTRIRGHPSGRNALASVTLPVPPEKGEDRRIPTYLGNDFNQFSSRNNCGNSDFFHSAASEHYAVTGGG